MDVTRVESHPDFGSLVTELRDEYEGRVRIGTATPRALRIADDADIDVVWVLAAGMTAADIE